MSCSCWVTSVVTSNKEVGLFVVVEATNKVFFLVSALQCEEKKKKTLN